MKQLILFITLLGFSFSLFSQNGNVSVVSSSGEWTMMVDGQPFMVNGMNWDYFPVGTNFN
jgi:hypothetical protein